MIDFRRYFFRPIRDFIYPPLCFTCSAYLGNEEEGVCEPCWKSFTEVNPSHTAWMELKSRFRTEGKISDFISCFLFEDGGKLQEVVHLLKYRGMKSLGVRLGEEIGKRIASTFFSKADCLVPVPLHKLKYRERGYNQSEYICRGISELTGIPVQTAILRRKKYTESQTALSPDKRTANVGDAFEVEVRCRPMVKGKRIIIVDDVITTGSTVNACAAALLSCDAAEILAVSAALAR